MVITPIIDLALPLVGSVIKGTNSALELAKWLKPQIMLPTANGGDVTFEGLVTNFLKYLGSFEEFRLSLEKNNLATRVIEPLPGDCFELQLEKRALAI